MTEVVKVVSGSASIDDLYPILGVCGFCGISDILSCFLKYPEVRISTELLIQFLIICLYPVSWLLVQIIALLLF